MNKLIIGLIVAAILGTGSYLIFRSETGIDVSFVNQDENDLDRLSGDMAKSDEDEASANEFDETAADLAEVTLAGGVSTNTALDETAISQEAAQADFSQTLNDTATDEATLKEMEKVYVEVSQ